MRLSSKPISSPGRADKFPPPLTRFLRSNVGSRSRGRSRSSPMFVRKKNASAGVETQEPSSPKVTCIGQVRVRRSKQAGVKPSRSRTTAPKRRFRWIRKAFVCNYSTRKIKPKSSCSCSRPIWRRWFLFFQVGYRRNVDSAKDTTVGESKIEEEINGDSDRVDEDEEVEEDRAKVSISSPPKNALLLMRSRSAPYRASSLANRFWGSPSRIEDAANENKVQETQDREEKEERPTSGIEVICRDSAAESRKCPETEEKLGFSDEFQSSSSDPSTKTTGISILQPQLMEGEYPRPLVLTRSKSEPAARITTRRFDPETEVSFWKKRRLRLGERCPPHVYD